MLVDVLESAQAKELERFRVENPAHPSMPSVLGIRLMELLLRNIPLRLVPDLKPGPKASGF